MSRIAKKRQQTIDEIVHLASEVMAEAGAAALSLGEIAKRMGMRTPSLYGYFASKSALCDEIYARGWGDLADTMEPHYRVPGPTATAAETLSAGMHAFVGWALEHRAPAELMFWRPIAGWHPSREAYAAAVDLNSQLASWLSHMQDAGLLRDDIAIDELSSVLIVISTGIITQQLANQPGVDVNSGEFSSRIDVLVDTYLSRYGVRHD